MGGGSRKKGRYLFLREITLIDVKIRAGLILDILIDMHL